MTGSRPAYSDCFPIVTVSSLLNFPSGFAVIFLTFKQLLKVKFVVYYLRKKLCDDELILCMIVDILF